MKSIVKHVENKINKPFPKIMKTDGGYLYLVYERIQSSYIHVLLYDPTNKEAVGTVYNNVNFLSDNYKDWTGSITLIEE